MNTRHRVIIIGGGFGGLRAARALKSAPVDVTLIDRRNYHLFQPLLYQVATGSLSPGQHAAPRRGVLGRQKNTRVLRYANVVGRENVIAGTDCGLGIRVGHEEIMWAKLDAMVEGARIASKQLWK